MFTIKKLIDKLDNIISGKRIAFTLAEVLVTLGIIGVVAAITMPTLIKNHKKTQTVNQLKKSYSQLSQAIKLSEIQNGETKYWDFGLDSRLFLNTYIVPFLKNTQILSTSNYNSKIKYKFLNGDIASTDGFYGYTTKLSDGTIIFIDKYIPEGKSFRSIYIDINGEKNPNMFGKDLFVFIVNKNSQIKPYGSHNARDYLTSTNTQSCNKNSSQFPGMSCAALIMLDGWKISDDYPW